MSSLTMFQRGLFGSIAGLSGWPSDGLDEPELPLFAETDLKRVPMVSPHGVLGLAALTRQLDARTSTPAPAAGRPDDGA